MGNAFDADSPTGLIPGSQSSIPPHSQQETAQQYIDRHNGTATIYTEATIAQRVISSKPAPTAVGFTSSAPAIRHRNGTHFSSPLTSMYTAAAVIQSNKRQVPVLTTVDYVGVSPAIGHHNGAYLTSVLPAGMSYDTTQVKSPAESEKMTHTAASTLQHGYSATRNQRQYKRQLRIARATEELALANEDLAHALEEAARAHEEADSARAKFAHFLEVNGRTKEDVEKMQKRLRQKVSSYITVSNEARTVKEQAADFTLRKDGCSTPHNDNDEATPIALTSASMPSGNIAVTSATIGSDIDEPNRQPHNSDENPSPSSATSVPEIADINSQTYTDVIGVVPSLNPRREINDEESARHTTEADQKNCHKSERDIGNAVDTATLLVPQGLQHRRESQSYEVYNKPQHRRRLHETPQLLRPLIKMPRIRNPRRARRQTSTWTASPTGASRVWRLRNSRRRRGHHRLLRDNRPHPAADRLTARQFRGYRPRIRIHRVGSLCSHQRQRRSSTESRSTHIISTKAVALQTVLQRLDDAARRENVRDG